MRNEEARDEWGEAQKIVVCQDLDLVDAAKKQLQFLVHVDRNRQLYEPPFLDWAIYRYNAFWLPLLAKHSRSAQPLVVPLDCEWIWHCHRLNPVRYKLDCEQLFGAILDNHNAISSLQATSDTLAHTHEIWKSMYPQQPYDLQLNGPLPTSVPSVPDNQKFTTYDLVSAVKRQIPFSFQVSRPHMSNHLFLQEGVDRYKGFLHLIRTNRNNNLKRFCVPTYDIDLIWHTHQLHPLCYSQDLTLILGKVLEHDDTDSDRTKGKKLDTGFSETTKQWEDTFGFSYWKAGAMHRGRAPTPVAHIPSSFTSHGLKNIIDATNNHDNLIKPPAVKAVEVLLQFVGIKNLAEGHKGNLLVSFSKKKPDKLFKTKRELGILSESGQKQVAIFQCESTGEFVFELLSLSYVRSNIPNPKQSKSLGFCSISLQDVLSSPSKLSVDKWLPVVPPISTTTSLDPILLHVSVSFTIPEPAPQVFHLLPSPRNPSSLPISGSIKSQHLKSWTSVIDDDGNDVLNLQMRNIRKEMNENPSDLLKEVVYITDSGDIHTLAEFVGKEWCMKGKYGSLKLCPRSGKNGHLFDFVGRHKMVKLFPGRKLEYELRHYEKQRGEHDFITAVEFSSDYPYGRAVSLIDLSSGTFKVKDEWMILPGITLTFVLLDILKREGYTAFSTRGNTEDENSEMVKRVENLVNGNSQSGGCGNGCAKLMKSEACGGCGVGCVVGRLNAFKPGDCGGAGGSCDSGCGGDGGTVARSGDCGGGGGSCDSGCGGDGGN